MLHQQLGNRLQLLVHLMFLHEYLALKGFFFFFDNLNVGFCTYDTPSYFNKKQYLMKIFDFRLLTKFIRFEMS